MTNKEREDVINRMRKGETWILITTEVMARGMDFKGVREVINYDFPTSVQSYVHRIGEHPICLFSLIGSTPDFGKVVPAEQDGKAKP